MTTKKDAAKDFESSLKKLEEIVDEMENNDLPLDEALALFKEGVELNKFCGGKLKAAEEEVKKVVEQEDGSYQLEIFSREDK